VQAHDKKKADRETGLKVFRRGCLKGTALLACSDDCCKCEGRKNDCTTCNQARDADR